MKFDFTKYVSTDIFLTAFSICLLCESRCRFEKEGPTFVCDKCNYNVGLTTQAISECYIPVPRTIELAFSIAPGLVISVERNNVILHQQMPAIGEHKAWVKRKILLESNPIDLEEVKSIADKYKILK